MRRGGGHGCLGIAPPGNRRSGSGSRRVRIDVALNVDPVAEHDVGDEWRDRVGRSPRSETTARQSSATRLQVGRIRRAVSSSCQNSTTRSGRRARRSPSALGAVDDAGAVLVDDGHPGAFAGGVGQRVVGEDRSAEVEQGDEHEQEERDDEGELDKGLAPAVVERRRGGSGVAGSWPVHRTSLLHGDPRSAVRDLGV